MPALMPLRRCGGLFLFLKTTKAKLKVIYVNIETLSPSNMPRAEIPNFFETQLTAYAQTGYSKSNPARARINGKPIRIYDRSSGNFKSIGWKVPVLFFPLGWWRENGEETMPPIQTFSIILDETLI